MSIEFPSRALLSVSDKHGIQSFARGLQQANIAILSTGGTLSVLREAHVTAEPVESLTHFPEILDGRVKTLHPRLFAGVLAKRDCHQDEMQQHQLPLISLVVVNFYPFEQHCAEIEDEKKIIELIDIGGPALVRAAAKNFAWVSAVVDPADYNLILQELNQYAGIRLETRRELAKKAFARVAEYDAAIHAWFSKTALSFSFSEHAELRYGENPHQQAQSYQLSKQTDGVLSAVQHQGKQLSYNNILDSDAALNVGAAFSSAPFAVVIKHTHVCGAAQAPSIDVALQRAIAADAQSAFGGIFLLNRTCDAVCAQQLQNLFVEVVLAPSFTDEALQCFKQKPNMRVLSLPIAVQGAFVYRWIEGGLLKQTRSTVVDPHHWNVVTEKMPPTDAAEDIQFAWQAVQHVQSNAILIAKNKCTVGIGAGQVSRIDAVKIALMKAGERALGSVLASDAFFPFRDGIDLLRDQGIHTIIQPGGSIRDQDVIDACNELGIAMIFTGVRGFKH